MNIFKLTSNIIAAEFETQKEMMLTVARPAEYYESIDERLHNQAVSWSEFLNVFMTDAGVIEYFSSWSGFNLPGEKLLEWYTLCRDASTREITFFNSVLARCAYNVVQDDHHRYIDGLKVRYAPFYVVAFCAGDEETIKHEIAHALFYLDPKYKQAMLKLNKALPAELAAALTTAFNLMGYRESVHQDEMQAYLIGASHPDEIFDKLTTLTNVDIKQLEQITRKYQKLFNVYWQNAT